MFLRNFGKPVIIVDVDMHVTELEPSRRIPSIGAQVVSTPLKSMICRPAVQPLDLFHHIPPRLR
jgi:hypothetical protein